MLRVYLKRIVNSAYVQLPKSSKDLPKKAGRSMEQVRANKKHAVTTPQHLAKQMNISLDKAKQIMRVTTQKGIRTAVYTIRRRYIVNHFDVHTTRLAGKWYANSISAESK